jgi:hypothetical protein
MAKVTTGEHGVATFELETREAFQQFQKGLEHGEHQWAANAETNELMKFKSENCQHNRIFVKYGEFHKQLK